MKFSSFLFLTQIMMAESFAPSYTVTNKASTCLYSSSIDPLEQTKKQLQKMSSTSEFDQDEEILYKKLIMKPASALKEELKSLRLQTKGRKPDLAKRLVEYYIENSQNDDYEEEEEVMDMQVVTPDWNEGDDENIQPLRKFAKLPISKTAGYALAKANFLTPTPIQESALPLLSKDKESLILHAETGSGKTLTYLLPITERLWREDESEDVEGGYALILTPTRELAAQVAGIASVLAPLGSVRLVSNPTNLVRDNYEDRERSEGDYGGRFDNVVGGRKGTKIIVGSAKSIMLSLFGSSKLIPPTSKPEAKKFMADVSYLVLDEVDRLLNIKTGRGKTSKYYKKHDKPAAILTSTIAKFTLGQAQVVAASATVGRPLRRELARVLGLAPDECPRVVRATGSVEGTSTRPITTPGSLTHYAVPCDGSTSGSLLTTASFVAKALPKIDERGRKILFVVTKACGIHLKDAIGALKHFNVKPEPKALLDVLEADGTDRLMENHRRVTGAAGLGERSANVAFDEKDGYLLVTGEDTVRGIHLDQLDTVVVVGRPTTPDEYIHIAGRAGRAGATGSVVNIIQYEKANALASWEGQLGISFIPMDESEISSIQ